MTMWYVVLSMFDDGMQMVLTRKSDITFYVTDVSSYQCV